MLTARQLCVTVVTDFNDLVFFAIRSKLVVEEGVDLNETTCAIFKQCWRS